MQVVRREVFNALTAPGLSNADFVAKVRELATRLQDDLRREEIYFMLGLSNGRLLANETKPQVQQA